MTYRITVTPVGTHLTFDLMKDGQEQVAVRLAPDTDVVEGAVSIAGGIEAYGETFMVQPVDQPEPSGYSTRQPSD